MTFPLTARIAWRFLRSKKKHSAVSAIAMVSVAGMAVATAAIVCVLSVFNGFSSVIGDRLDTLAPDLAILPLKGKAFPGADSLAASLKKFPEIRVASPTLSDNALALIDGREMPVVLKGVDPEAWRATVRVDSVVLPDDGGRFLANDARREAVAAVGVAARIGAFPGRSCFVFVPKRRGKVNMANPAASFLSDSLELTGVFRTDQALYDENLLITDLPTARRLFDRPGEASAIEIRLFPGADPDKTADKINSLLGPDLTTKTRFRMQEMNFRMVKIEKWVSFLLLFFILLTASFNIISTMSMLTLEKRRALHTLRALGLTRRRVGRVFFWESIYVGAIGGGAGIIAGVLLSLGQQKFGWIRLAAGGQDSLPYPVKVIPSDILVTILPVAAIALASAFITAAYSRSLINKKF